ncbi:glycosyltransferase family 2 protein [Rosenbergiella nectarea]|uniref:glycosyltransferase family 2 protein n=2 Tax=Rosenbergiella nectarea TaxID=988801 RepID=UPI001F4DCA18|nr:glycosyltransferase family 2 protein [Rosenbergiella nectarea]
MNDMTVAIILPVYNASETLDRAITSVLAQSYTNFTLYIIDDFSKDNSREIINKYIHDKNIKVMFNDKNLGVAESRNRGLNLAVEDVVAFIDSDDEWLKDKLETQISRLSVTNGLPNVSHYNFISDQRKLVGYDKNLLSRKDFLKKEFRICLSSLVHKRNNVRFKKIGHEDFIYISSLYDLHGHISVTNKPLVNYYVTEGSLSSNKITAACWQFNLLSKELKLPRHKVIYYFFFYALNALLFRN